jgi:hypothetical protein
VIIRGGAPKPKSIDDLMGPSLMAALDRLDVRSRKVFAGKMAGERRSKQRGRGVEFADYREYAPGDDLRFIDWNVFARLDRMFIKMFLEEQDLALHIALDASPSMEAGAPSSLTERGATKLIFAQRLAMSLAYVGLINRNRVSVSIFGDGALRRLPEMRGRHQVQRAAGFLINEVRPTEARAGGGPDFNESLRAIALTRRGKGVMVVLSDFLVREGYEAGLNALGAGLGRESGAGDAFDTYCLQILSPGELDPANEGAGAEAGVVGDVRFTDIETGESREVTVSAALLKQYKANLERYLGALATFCAARGMMHTVVRSDTDVEDVLLDTLRRRGLLG